MNKHDSQVGLLMERIERLTSQVETMNEKLDRLLDPENGVYAKGMLMENRIANVEKLVSYGKWFALAVVGEAIHTIWQLLFKR